MKVLYKKSFIKSYEVLSLKLKDKVKDTLSLFIKNPKDKILNNHWLEWKYKWKRSINVAWDMRIIFQELSQWKYELVELYNIRTHSQLYK